MSTKEIDFDLIRTALIQYAESRGRPHFDVVIVREVINAFINGTEHWLKGVVNEFVGSVAEKKPTCWHDIPACDKRSILIAEFCHRTGASACLSNHSGISRSYLSDMACGKKPVSDKNWTRILGAMNKAEKDYQQKVARGLVYVKKKLARCGVSA